MVGVGLLGTLKRESHASSDADDWNPTCVVCVTCCMGCSFILFYQLSNYARIDPDCQCRHTSAALV
jgi:hypothetical protein